MPSDQHAENTPHESSKGGDTLTELTDTLRDLPNVHDVVVCGDDNDSKLTTVVVTFMDFPGRTTADVDEIMRLSGWESDGTSFSQNQRLYVECGGNND